MNKITEASNLVTDAEAKLAKEMGFRVDEDGYCLNDDSEIQRTHPAFQSLLWNKCLRLLSERERLLAIVRAMTNREPYYRDEDANLHCSICGTLLPDFGEADNHDETCPYRLATEYMAEVTK